MAQMQFSMEKILDWRVDIEDEKKRQVGALREQYQQMEATLSRLLKESMKIKHEGLKVSEIHSLRSNHYYKVVLDEKIIQQKNQMDRLQAEINQAQQELVHAHQDKRAMEKLKEKELEAKYLDELRREQLQLDEIATMNYKRVPL